MKFERVSPDEKAVPNPREQLGLRSKLGGIPDWDQDDETPICPRCKKKMCFIAQIDSFENTKEYNPHPLFQDYMFGDVGMIYVFLCYDCMETKSIVQGG